MRIMGYLRKEAAQIMHDPVGLIVGAVLPVAIVGLYAQLDLGRRAFPHEFRDTDPLALILTMSIWLAGLTLASTAILKERLGGTLSRLQTTPFSRWGVVVSKVAVLGMVGAAQGALVWTAALVMVPGELGSGSGVTLLLVLVAAPSAAVSTGLALSAFATTHAQAAHGVTLLTLASITLSGFLKPLGDLGALGFASRLLPFTLAYDATIEAAGGRMPWLELALLLMETAFLVGLAAIAVRSPTRTPA